MSHQANTVMKHSIDKVRKSQIFQDLGCVKKVVKIFKKGGLNDDLPDRAKLKQQFPARFETTFDVVQRFLNSISLIDEVIEKNLVDYGSAVQANEKFAQVYREVLNGEIVYPGLRGVINVFVLLLHAQTLLESSNKITTASVLRVLERVK